MVAMIQELTEGEISARLAEIDHRKERKKSYNPRFPPELFNDFPQYAAVLVPMLKISGEWKSQKIRTGPLEYLSKK